MECKTIGFKMRTAPNNNDVQWQKKPKAASQEELNLIFSEFHSTFPLRHYCDRYIGDENLWNVMWSYFADNPPSKDNAIFEEELNTAFLTLTGKATSELTIRPEETDQLSCGKTEGSTLSKAFWKSSALPLLIERMKTVIGAGK